jgi:hypothetical protein
VDRERNLAIVTIGIMLATLMQTLDTTIVNVALPIIQGNLGATLDEGAWVVTAYIVAAVIVIPLTPWLQERFGRRNYYAAAIARGRGHGLHPDPARRDLAATTEGRSRGDRRRMMRARAQTSWRR